MPTPSLSSGTDENPYQAPEDFEEPEPARRAIGPATWGAIGLGLSASFVSRFLHHGPSAVVISGFAVGMALFLFGVYMRPTSRARRCAKTRGPVSHWFRIFLDRGGKR